MNDPLGPGEYPKQTCQLGREEQQALVLAAGASRTTWQVLACVFKAREAQREATEPTNTPDVRVRYREIEQHWWREAYVHFAPLELQAPELARRLEELAFGLDAGELDPPRPVESGPSAGSAAVSGAVPPEPWDGVPAA